MNTVKIFMELKRGTKYACLRMHRESQAAGVRQQEPSAEKTFIKMLF